MLVIDNRRYDVECSHSSDASLPHEDAVLQQSALHQAALPLHQAALPKHVVVVFRCVHTVAYTTKVVEYTTVVLIAASLALPFSHACMWLHKVPCTSCHFHNGPCIGEVAVVQVAAAGEDSRCESHDSCCAGWWL